MFFTGIRDYYKAVTSTIVKKFSFNDKVMEDIAILLPEHRSKVTSAAVFRLASRFSAAVSDDNFDTLEEEVLDYVLAPTFEIPSVHRDENSTKSAELCAYWRQVDNMKTLQGKCRFPYLVSLYSPCLFQMLILRGYSA